MKKLVALLLTMLMLVAVFTSMASAASKPIKIKFAYMPPELTPEECVETTIAYTFRDYLEEHFPDRFQVEIYPSGQLDLYHLWRGLLGGGRPCSAVVVLYFDNRFRRSAASLFIMDDVLLRNFNSARIHSNVSVAHHSDSIWHKNGSKGKEEESNSRRGRKDAAINA